jgi:hypothetical protein
LDPLIPIKAQLKSQLKGSISTVHFLQERLREELMYRIMLMAEEMEKWRQQALMTSTAVMEAKNEVGAVVGLS